MPYIIVRLLIPAYLIGFTFMWLNLISDLVFQRGKRRWKNYFLRAAISFVWPLALINRNGRKKFLQSFKRIFN